MIIFDDKNNTGVIVDKRILARKNLEKRLAPLRDMNLRPPSRGWIRAIRDALGMTGEQLAKRIGVTQPRIIALEKAEAQETVTLKTLRDAAAAMDCTLVYAFVPTRSLDEIVHDRAVQRADMELRRVSHTMALENQSLSLEDLAFERRRKIAEVAEGTPRRLWDDT